MNKLIASLAALVFFATFARGQDLTGLIERSPEIASVLARALERCPSFSAKVDISYAAKPDPAASTALGTFDYAKGNLRWEANLGDIRSGQLTTQARAAVRQINGDQFLLITRSDKMANYLVLAKAQSCLEQPLPTVKLSNRKIESRKETFDGRVCRKEKAIARVADGSTNEVVLWSATDLKGAPLLLQISDSAELFRIHFTNVKLEAVPSSRFQVPGGLATYASFEDLIQSVLLDRLKRRMGLDR